MHILIALVVCILLGVLGYTVSKLYEKMCDHRLSMLVRFSMSWSAMWLVFASLFVVVLALQWLLSQVWVMIFDPITGLILGGAALIGFGGKKIHQRRMKKKYADDVAKVVREYSQDFEWDQIPFEIKFRLAQHKKLFLQLLEKYSGADFDSTKPTSFVPDEIVELFEDGNQPILFVPYFPRFFIALHQYKELVKATDTALVYAGAGMKGWVYTHIIKFQRKAPTEAFNSMAHIQYDRDEIKKCIEQIEEYVRNVEYFLECSCKELGARGSRVFRARVHERARILHYQARTIEMFVSQMGHASSAEDQRDLVIEKIELLCNNMLVDPGDGYEIKLLPKGTQVFQGDAQEELKRRYARIEQERIILEQQREDARREKMFYFNKKIELEQSRQLEARSSLSLSVPLQLTQQVDQTSPFSQPLPNESVVTTFVAPVALVTNENAEPVSENNGAANDSKDAGEHEVAGLQRVMGS